MKPDNQQSLSGGIVTQPPPVWKQEARTEELVPVAWPDHSVAWLSPREADEYFKFMRAALKVQFLVATLLLVILMWAST
ncbi:hypothetical protein J7E49_13750 [Variovorax paradoxus]|nr:hypothetical protein [Variovorax paradoxus]